jgi:hypothetical protein
MKTRLALALTAFCSTAHAATFVVDNAGTNSGSACTAAPNDCSFDGAVLRANNNAGSDTIEFNIPSTDPNCSSDGVCTITVNNPAQGGLFLIGPLIVDGYTQPGSSVNTLPVGQGTNAALKIVLKRFPFSSAINISNAATVRGIAFQLPVFVNGLFPGPDQGTKTIVGNFFGLSADGINPAPELPNYNLITVTNGATNVRMGSANPADMNVFATTPAAGSNVGCLTLGGEGTVLRGNLIGTDRTGLRPLNCTFTLQLEGSSNAEIGGNQPGEGNVIAGSFDTAILINAPSARFRGNKIGVGVDGITPIPNVIQPANTDSAGLRGNNQATFIQIGGTQPGDGNIIALSGATRPLFPSTPPFRTTPAIRYPGRWAILGNSFLANDGVSVRITEATQHLPNDAGDGDSSQANNRQNFPEISAFNLSGNQLSLAYRVDSATSNASYPLTIEFYRARGGNAEQFLGRDTYLNSEAQSSKSISLTIPPSSLTSDDTVIAIAVDSPTGNELAGESSEFSFYPMTLTLEQPLPSSCTGNQHIFCDGFDVPPLRSLEARVRATSAVFKPNGRVYIRDTRGASCTAELVPSSTPLTSVGSCILAGSGAPGSITIIADSDAGRSSFAAANGNAVTVNQQFVIGN